MTNPPIDPKNFIIAGHRRDILVLEDEKRELAAQVAYLEGENRRLQQKVETWKAVYRSAALQCMDLIDERNEARYWAKKFKRRTMRLLHSIGWQKVGGYWVHVVTKDRP